MKQYYAKEKEMINQFMNLLNVKKVNRHMVSNIIFYLCGIVEFLYVIGRIVPFTINWKFTYVEKFISTLTMDARLNDSLLIVNSTIGGFVTYGIMCIFNELLMHMYQEDDNSKYAKKVAVSYSLCDISNLISAILSATFIFSTIIQLFQMQVLFFSTKAILIYLVIAYRSIKFLFLRYYGANMKIIADTIKKYK